MRAPRPERMKPPESQNAMAMSQGISLANAENAAGKERMPVSWAAPRPIMATAPKGTGWVMMPAMVPRKMPSRRHAFSATPAGGGTAQIAAPRPTHTASFFTSAFFGCFLAGAGVAVEVFWGEGGWKERGEEGHGIVD